jgi:hypothetical protein
MFIKRLFMVFVLCVIAGTSIILFLNGGVDFDNLSEQQLIDAGYYLYLISETYQEKMNWQREISMHSFDWHCTHDMDSRDDRWNYIHIKYVDSYGNRVLSIRISPNDALFDDENAESAQISTNINDLNEPIYYDIGGINRVKFVNSQGIEVVITSYQDLEAIEVALETFSLVGSMDNHNPWDKNCD